MIVSNNKETVDRIAKFRAFSVDRTHSERKVPGIYDVADIGMNYRMSEMQGALGRTQLKKLPEILKRRKQNFDALKAGLEEIGDIRVIDDTNPSYTNTYYCLIAVLEGDLAAKRDDIILALQAMGVGTSVYYPHPVSRLTAYKKRYGYTPGTFMNAETISDCSIALPVGPHLGPDDMADIASALKTVIEI